MRGRDERGRLFVPIFIIGSHDSDTQLGTTPVVSGSRMLMIGHGPARPKRPPHGKQGRNEAVDRPITNEAQHGGTREVSLERAEEKKSVDRPDPVCSYIRAKAFYVHNSRNIAAKLLKHTLNVI